MSEPTADRNLLFGILAMQMDFITREQLIAAMQAWTFDKSKSLGQVLLEHRALADDNRTLLDALVSKHLEKHDNNPEKSLASLGSATSVCTELGNIADVDVQASLSHVPAPQSQTEMDPYATVAPPFSKSPATGGPLKDNNLLDFDAPPSLGGGPVSSGRFRVVRPHAKGGLGEVFVARDQELNREVALKEIQDHQADNPDSRARFLLEAEITGGLEHPGIVPVYGLGAYPDGRPYYAMRFIRGDSLKEAIDRYHKAIASMSSGERALGMRELLGRLIDVCNAIAYAHSRGILHRDLKPGNIMLGKYGETLVVDWGLAKPVGEAQGEAPSGVGEGSLMPSSLSLASATMAGAAVGTPQYMSPEQALGKLDQLGPASDVYSLGATLYCILTGKSPVNDHDVFSVLQRVQRGDIPRPREISSDVPPALEAICVKAMSLKAEDRYPTPKFLAEDIEHWLADEPVSAWEEPWTVRARRWIGRHATLVTSVASAAAIALVSLIIATILLTAANERERKARKDEEIAKQKAEENYQLARQAVDRYHTDTSEDVILHEPGMQPLRRRLLLAASEYYKKFRKDRAGDASVAGEYAKATFRLAQITSDIGSRKEAIKLHEEAAQLLESLAAEKQSLATRTDLATCYHHLGRIYRQTGDLKKSEASFDKAIAEWEKCLKESPKDAKVRAGLARSQLGLGNVFQDGNHRLPDAEKLYQTALDTRRDLAADDPKDAEVQRDLAVSHNNRAVLFKKLGKDAEAEHRKGLRIQEQLVADYPHISKYQDDLARTHFVWGLLYAAPTEEDVELEEAVRIWDRLKQRHPAHTDYGKMFAEANSALGRANRKKAEQAVATQRKLAAEHKDDASFQANLARGLRALGDVHRTNYESKDSETAYEEAIAILGKLADPAPHHRSERAAAYNGLGLLYSQRFDEAKANAAFNDSKALWEKLVEQFPADDEYAVGLSVTYTNLGNVARFAKKHNSAQPLFTQALACLDAKKLKSLDAAPVRDALYQAYWGRAETLTALQLYDDALPDWNQTVTLAPKAKRPAYQVLRATTLARAGKYQDATKELGGLVRLFDNDPRAMYKCACAYSLAVAAVTADSKTPEPERLKLATSYASQSAKLLHAAAQLGLFASPEDRKMLNEPDLDAVRSRPELKTLLGLMPSR